MASNGVNPTTGAPRFPVTDAPDVGVDEEIIADYAVFRGGLLRGTSAERAAFAYPTEGLYWQDTNSTKLLYRYVGSSWVVQGGSNIAVTVSGVSDTSTAGTDVVKTWDGWVKGHISLKRTPLTSGEGVTLGVIQGANRPTVRYTVGGVVTEGGSAANVIAVVLPNGNIQYFGTPGGNTRLDFDIQYRAAV